MNDKKRPIPAYSYSLINGFLTCPQRFYFEKVEKSVPFVQNEAAKFGSEGHDAADKAIKNCTVPEGKFGFMAPAIKAVYKAAGEAKVYSEYGIGLTEDLKPTTFREGFLKGKLDVFYAQEPYATIVDWKIAGYSKGGGPKRYQLETDVFSYLVLKSKPEIEKVRSTLVWLKDGDKGPPTVDTKTKEDLPYLEDGIMKHIEQIENALTFGDFPAKKSGLCAFCPCKGCRHWKQTKFN